MKYSVFIIVNPWLIINRHEPLVFTAIVIARSSPILITMRQYKSVFAKGSAVSGSNRTNSSRAESHRPPVVHAQGSLWKMPWVDPNGATSRRASWWVVHIGTTVTANWKLILKLVVNHWSSLTGLGTLCMTLPAFSWRPAPLQRPFLERINMDPGWWVGCTDKVWGWWIGLALSSQNHCYTVSQGTFVQKNNYASIVATNN